MKHPKVDLRSVNSLLTEKFFVPSYQRGYRWTEVQVTDLLDDLWEFQKDSGGKGAGQFYCLQPLVIKARDNGSWEVVDGQQRLTTIFLILAAQKQRVELLLGKKSFELSFETRATTSESFLKDIDPERAGENIDFFHISRAYEAIKAWFDSRDGSESVRLIQTLLNNDEVGKNTQVIWYELPGTENSIEAFTRLNIGKIPLTNSELIRALFLRSENFRMNTRDLQQLRIAQEWDLIEKTLQVSDFWYFLQSGQNTPANRIEYLFDLMVRDSGADGGDSTDIYRSFHYFNGLLKSGNTSAEQEWLKVKQLFMMLEEWFRDRVLYHLTGFLIHVGVSITELRREALQLPKSEFDRYLRQRIYRELFGTILNMDEGETLDAVIEQKLSDVDYGDSKQLLRSVLLLFNIATLLENERSNLRFPFDSFKTEDWDIEHVSSVESARPDRPDAQKRWLEGVKNCYAETGEKEELRGRMESVIASTPFNKDGFDQIYDEVLAYCGESESGYADNRIENLTLLDQSTNRSYKNAVFPVKRHRILSLDRSGTFVPLCTRNVFLKCYSQELEEMLRWGSNDKRDYRRQISTILAGFFQKTETLKF
jgi:hypothetical protein